MITANWDLSPNLSPAVSFRGQRPVKPYQELPRSPSSEESAWVSPKTIIGAISLRASGIWRSVEIHSSCSDPSPWARATFTDGWIYEWTHYIGEARASPTQLILTPWYSSAPPLQKKVIWRGKKNKLWRGCARNVSRLVGSKCWSKLTNTILPAEAFTVQSSWFHESNQDILVLRHQSSPGDHVTSIMFNCWLDHLTVYRSTGSFFFLESFYF